MVDFVTQAKELLEISDNFKKEIKSKEEKTEDVPNFGKKFFPLFFLGACAGVTVFPLVTYSITRAIAGFASTKLLKLTQDINDSPQKKYNTKEISEKTGLEDWKLRRYIVAKKLKADSNKSSDSNPGRYGYSISKEDLIKFIKENESEITQSKKMTDSIEQYISASKSCIDCFLARVDPVIELGNLEIKLAKLEHPEESKEVIAKEILLQNLKSEKLFFEEQRKYLEQATLNWLAESSTEQTTETK